MKIFINGAHGRMGKTILELAPERGVKVAGKADQGDALEAAGLDRAEVVIDFSLHDATAPLAEAAAARGLPLVIGTTGHTEAEREAILGHADRIPIVWSGNYSIGVNVLHYLAELASEKLPDVFEPEIIEAHHHHKVDAPSGTAQNLVDAVLQGRGWSRDCVIFGREGMTGERPIRQVGVHAVRGGGIIGDHTVMFAGPSERVELIHRAGDRRIFAQGALRAAEWAIGRSPGLYSMRDVLGLTGGEES